MKKRDHTLDRSSKDLKPCPFCGGEATYEYDSDWGIHVVCKNCGGQMVERKHLGVNDVIVTRS